MSIYQFSKTVFTNNSAFRQWLHLLSEVVEVGIALLGRKKQKAAEEVWDVKHSAETLHRILEARGAAIEEAKEAVADNNRRRGYYLTRW